MDIDPNANTAVLPKPGTSSGEAGASRDAETLRRSVQDARKADDKLERARENLARAKARLQNLIDNPSEFDVMRVGKVGGGVAPGPHRGVPGAHRGGRGAGEGGRGRARARRKRKASRMGLARAALLLLATLLPLSRCAQTLYKLVDKTGKVSLRRQGPQGVRRRGDADRHRPRDQRRRARFAALPAARPRTRPRTATRRGATHARACSWRSIARRRSWRPRRKRWPMAWIPQDDEYQTIQQKFDASSAKPDAAGPRSNCRRFSQRRRTVHMGLSRRSCPGEKYRDRQ